MRTFLLVAISLCGLSLCSGCASIVSGTTQEVTFRSLPPGAEVFVNGQSIGTTPVSVPVKRAKNAAVHLKKQGYEEGRFTMPTGRNPWMFGNLIFVGAGAPFFSTTDRRSGAAIEFEPDHYYCVLDPDGASATMSRVDIRRQRLARFIAVNDSFLSRDLAAGGDRGGIVRSLAAGGGEYLDAVWQILDEPKEKREDALTKLRELRARYPRTPDFAENAGRALVVN